jgi:Flp pilus assembly protein TadD
MLRTLVFATAVLAAIAAAVASAIELRARQDARGLAHEAELVLKAPRQRALELTRLDATRALRLLEQASGIHDEPRTEALTAWARALEEYQNGRSELAARTLATARHGLPPSADLDALAGAIAIQSGRRDVAGSWVSKALALDPAHARARVLEADLAADDGQPQRARALLQRLIAELPEVGALYNRLGLIEETLGDEDAALVAFERAASLDPGMPQPHINLGRLLREQGRARDAERAFALAIERAASLPEAWLGRGLSRIALGDVEGGRLDIEQARQLAPAEPAPLIALADLDAWHGRLEQAIERYRAALALGSDDAVGWVKLGNALARTRAYAEARAAFERALGLRPDLAAAENGLGATLIAQGERAAAEQAFVRAAELDSRDPNPLRNLAMLRKLRAGRRTPEHSRSLQPRDPSARLD